jgi:uncharacterized protein (TIGR03382 family)
MWGVPVSAWSHMTKSIAFRLLLMTLAGAGTACGPRTPGGEGQLSQAIDSNVVDGHEGGVIPQFPHRPVCRGGRYHCHSEIRTLENGQVQNFAMAAGFGPADLASAYSLDTGANPGATIAIIGAFGYPNAESDLATYRGKYGLPPCTSASGCFRVVNQSGQAGPFAGPPPPGDDWTIENALDLAMASAACPNCKLLLVQADDDVDNGLLIVQQVAVNLGATVVSNSWGGPEVPMQPAIATESYFQHPGVVTFDATGDSGYDDSGQGPDYPGTSAYVIGVGATTLTRASGVARGWTEWAWSSSGSGCSLSIPKPSWQGETGCSFKASADVSAVGDPNTGVAVYNADNGGWVVVGGTSAAAPLVAGIFALTGHGSEAPSFPYENAQAFNDVTGGSNGTCQGPLCNAGPGWDGPTGIGTPNGKALQALCTPQCSGKQCGDDGCRGSCGSCAAPQVCAGGGTPNVCGTGSCVPLTSCPTPTNCGELPDGCGGMIYCGSCASPESCGGLGQANVCGCKARTCASWDANCGQIYDGCGHTLNCGTCTAPQTCGGGAFANQCGCQPTTCAAQKAACGTVSDACGGELNCGGCPTGHACQANQCVISKTSGGCGCSSNGSPVAIAALLALAVTWKARRRVSPI